MLILASESSAYLSVFFLFFFCVLFENCREYRIILMVNKHLLWRHQAENEWHLPNIFISLTSCREKSCLSAWKNLNIIFLSFCNFPPSFRFSVSDFVKCRNIPDFSKDYLSLSYSGLYYIHYSDFFGVIVHFHAIVSQKNMFLIYFDFWLKDLTHAQRFCQLYDIAVFFLVRNSNC